MSQIKDLQIAAIIIILTVLFVLLPPLNTSPVRTILGIPMVLFLPGYALIAALFPRKNDLDGIERLALSFGLSIAVVPLIGLGLNFTPFGIRLVPILISLSVFTLAMLLIAYIRRSKLSEEERFEVPFSYMYSSLRSEIFISRKGVDRILSIILILSIVASIIILIYVIVTPKQGEKFTEFYILGDNGMAQGYPTRLEPGKTSSVIVGITNQEYVLTNYTLNISLENNTLKTIHVQLMHNSTWEEKVLFIPEKTGDNLKLEFLLYKEDNLTAPYRDLHLWVNSVALKPVDIVKVPLSEVTPTGKKIQVKIDRDRGYVNPEQANLKINPGDEIVWTNDDSYRITLISKEALFKDVVIDYGSRKNYVFKRKGTFNFDLKVGDIVKFNGTVAVG